MSYQVLARKWRPGTFEDMVGQGHVLKTLSHALDSERLHHAYLFTGTRGVGKTTVARILAKCLNCESGITSKPCGQCSACREISEGRFIDLIEVDAASRTKVEDTRDLLENVQYAPARGRFKIYLIDEVHMLSSHSFNALLKTLEEPPGHVKFLLATTDPQKLPITILSRCLQFNLKNLAPQMIVNYLQKVLEAEDIAFEEDALWQLASAAAGSMRDALTLLDQAISFGEGQVKAAGNTAMLGTPSRALIHAILGRLAERDAVGLLAVCEEISEHGPDYQGLLDAIVNMLHRVAIGQVLSDAVDNSFGDREQVLELSGKMSAEDVQLFYQIALKGRADMNLAADPRGLFEMLLIRMLVFNPGGNAVIPEPRTPQAEKKKIEQPVTKPADHRPWHELLPTLGASGIIGNILANCCLLAFADDAMHLQLDQGCAALFNDEHELRIRQLLEAHFGRPMSLTVTVGPLTEESPAAMEQRARSEKTRRMAETFEADPNVQQLLREFSGTVIADSITLVNK